MFWVSFNVSCFTCNISLVSPDQSFASPPKLNKKANSTQYATVSNVISLYLLIF